MDIDRDLIAREQVYLINDSFQNRKQYNIPVKYVQEQLGHTNAQTTLNVYNHVLKSTNQQAINLLENLKCEHKMSIDLTRALKKPTNSGLYNGGR